MRARFSEDGLSSSSILNSIDEKRLLAHLQPYHQIPMRFSFSAREKVSDRRKRKEKPHSLPSNGERCFVPGENRVWLSHRCGNPNNLTAHSAKKKQNKQNHNSIHFSTDFHTCTETHLIRFTNR